jgi:hypothetical protein
LTKSSQLPYLRRDAILTKSNGLDLYLPYLKYVEIHQVKRAALCLPATLSSRKRNFTKSNQLPYPSHQLLKQSINVNQGRYRRDSIPLTQMYNDRSHCMDLGPILTAYPILRSYPIQLPYPHHLPYPQPATLSLPAILSSLATLSSPATLSSTSYPILCSYPI